MTVIVIFAAGGVLLLWSLKQGLFVAGVPVYRVRVSPPFTQTLKKKKTEEEKNAGGEAAILFCPCCYSRVGSITLQRMFFFSCFFSWF